MYYKNALIPATDFKRFFGWFDLMEDEERRMKEKLKDWNYKSPVLNTVRNALSGFINSFQNPRIETKPLRFVMDRIEKDGNIHELRIEQMSDGYKIVISMVADLAARMAEANPSMPNPLIGKGIVLIDELDLHLHPSVERTVLKRLRATFTRVQWVVSTHSSLVLSAFEQKDGSNVIYKISKEESDVVFTPVANMQGVDASTGLKYTMDTPDDDSRLNDYKEAYDFWKSKGDTEKLANVKEMIKKIVGEDSLFYKMLK